MKLTDLIADAPWREAVTYRDTRPHEYVLARGTGSRNCWRRSASVSMPGRAWPAASSV